MRPFPMSRTPDNRLPRNQKNQIEAVVKKPAGSQPRSKPQSTTLPSSKSA